MNDKPVLLVIGLADDTGHRSWHETRREAWAHAETVLDRPGEWTHEEDDEDLPGGSYSKSGGFSVTVWIPTEDECCRECGRKLKDD